MPLTPRSWEERRTLGEGLPIPAPWFLESPLTPELYYFDSRAQDDDSSATEVYHCEDMSSDVHSDYQDGDVSVSSELSQYSDGFELQAVTVIPVSLYDSEDRVNKFAFDCLHRGFVSFQQLRELCEMLPPDVKPRKHVVDGAGWMASCFAPRCFTTGAYIFGGDAGTRSSLTAFPWVAKLLCGIVRAVAGDKPFTSVSLTLNQWSGVHVDAHNSKVFHNILIPAGCWDWGELWTADKTGDVTYPGTELLGTIRPVSQPYILLNATIPHAVMPWTGERVMICTFHIRDAWRLQEHHLLHLRDAGFTVATCEHDTDPYM